MRIGFIGLGNMGGPMAANLVKAGHQLAAFDMMKPAVDKAVAQGAHAAPSANDAARDAEVVVTMLPAGTHVRAVYLGDNGLLKAVKPGTLLIDSSTIDVATARDVQAAAKAARLDFLDAPVSGGVGGATAGTLTFMVGGEDAAFARAKQAWLASFLELPKGVPSADTLRRVMAALEPRAFEACFRSWVGALASALRGEGAPCHALRKLPPQVAGVQGK